MTPITLPQNVTLNLLNNVRCCNGDHVAYSEKKGGFVTYTTWFSCCRNPSDKKCEKSWSAAEEILSRQLGEKGKEAVCNRTEANRQKELKQFTIDTLNKLRDMAEQIKKIQEAYKQAQFCFYVNKYEKENKNCQLDCNENPKIEIIDGNKREPFERSQIIKRLQSIRFMPNLEESDQKLIANLTIQELDGVESITKDDLREIVAKNVAALGYKMAVPESLQPILKRGIEKPVHKLTLEDYDAILDSSL